MYKKLIEEYKQLLEKHHINNLNNRTFDEEKIFELNFKILANKNNTINKLLDNIFKSNEKSINFTNIKKQILFEPLLELIESYLDENKIDYLYNDENLENKSYDFEVLPQQSFIRKIISTSKPIYTPEEEKEVFKNLDKQNKKMVNEIIQHNYGLILRMISRYSTPFFTKDDLFSIGILGLYKAIDKFDVSKGYKFSTYATWWIRQAITREISNKKDTIRIPIKTQEDLKIYNKSVEILTEKLNRRPTRYEISKHSDFSISQIRQLEKSQIQNMSLQSTVQADSEVTIEEIIPSEENIVECVEKKIENEQLHEIITRIITNERNLKILKMRYGFSPYKSPMTFEAIGNEVNLSTSRIIAIIEAMQKKIKKEIEKKEIAVQYNMKDSKTYQKK